MHPIRNNVIEKQLKKIPVEKLAFSNLPAYIALQNSQYVFAKHHKLIVNALQKIEAGEINRLIVTMPPRHGKLLADSTDILTPDGWKKHGDLKVGDYVYGPDGKKTKVIWLAPKMLATFEVEFSNGEKIKCHENHEWYVHNRSSGKWAIYETKHFVSNTGRYTGKDSQLKLRYTTKDGRKSRGLYQLPTIKPIEFEERSLPIHPYVLGAWLGDGSSDAARFCSSKKDNIVLERIYECGYEKGFNSVHKDTGVIYQGYNGLLTILRKLDLLNNKHIPNIYKFSSIEQRLELLAGLIDTDGSVDKNGRVRIVSGNPVLVCDIKELIKSFGWRVCHYKQAPCISSSGIVGKKEVSYLGFQPTIQIPTKIPRKYINRIVKQRRISIKSITRCEPEPGNSIQVDRHDGLYLAGKSLIPTHNTMLISEYFPAWYLGRNPSHQILAATYSFDRANDTGRRVRNQLLTALYPKIFNTTLKPADAKSAHKISTAKGGNYFSVGIGGAVVGRGAHLFLIDDPIKSREDAESDISRRKLWDWFRGVAYERLMPTNAIVIVQTRWHFDDLVGRLLEKTASQNWVCLNLPAVCDEENDLIGRKIGEALWPDYKVGYPLEVLEEKKEIIGTREWTSQYQQKPLPTGGGMVDINWFKRYNYVDWLTAVTAVKFGDTNPRVPFDIYKIICSWDTAFKEKQLNDPSACTVWGISRDNKFYLLEAFAKRIKYPTLKKKTISMWEYYMQFNCGQVVVLIEDRASGQSLIQDLRDSTRIPVVAAEAVQSKQIRMDGVTALMEAGRMYVPDRAKWLVGYETEMARFPLWRTDDLADSTSQFLKWAGKPRYVKSKKSRFWK